MGAPSPFSHIQKTSGLGNPPRPGTVSGEEVVFRSPGTGHWVFGMQFCEGCAVCKESVSLWQTNILMANQHVCLMIVGL